MPQTDVEKEDRHAKRREADARRDAALDLFERASRALANRNRMFESLESQRVAADTANREEAARRWVEHELYCTRLRLERARLRLEWMRAVNAREQLRISEGRPLPHQKNYYRPDCRTSGGLLNVKKWQEWENAQAKSESPEATEARRLVQKTMERYREHRFASTRPPPELGDGWCGIRPAVDTLLKKFEDGLPSSEDVWNQSSERMQNVEALITSLENAPPPDFEKSRYAKERPTPR